MEGRTEGPLHLLKEKSSQEENEGVGQGECRRRTRRRHDPTWQPTPLGPGAPWISVLEVPCLTQLPHQGIVGLSIKFATRKVFVGAKL